MPSPPRSEATVAGGQPVDVCLVHGWGFGPEVWDHLVGLLPAHWRPHRLRLPGYGTMPEPASDIGLDGYVENLLTQAPRGRSFWMGWSLGGMVAMQLAWRHPHRVEALMLLAANVRFTSGPDWPCGVPADELRAISALLHRMDAPTTLRYFAKLVARGAPEPQRVQQQLRTSIETGSTPSRATLNAGLELLSTADLRTTFARLSQPTVVIVGDRDPLLPASAADHMRALNPRLQTVTVHGAGHALPVTHPEAVLEAAAKVVR
jgi:pimeloyl-[acyl-carrier protein] methyl ester esterase